ncbi:MAG TPA: hypothetical protein VLX92_26895 [Kofleriaceae bacterium]|nr:hypothetical protein [Kofleriaceae bacterium]
MAIAGGMALARPAENVSPRRHPNIAAAQRFTDLAFEKMTAAQEANEFDMAGHAAKAKDALRLASEEMKLAAETANR